MLLPYVSAQLSNPPTNSNGQLVIHAGPRKSGAVAAAAAALTSPTSSSSSSSTAGTVAAGALAVAAAGAAGLSIYAFATKQGIEQAAKHVWKKIKGE